VEWSLEVATEFTFEFQKAKAALLYLTEKQVPQLTKAFRLSCSVE